MWAMIDGHCEIYLIQEMPYVFSVRLFQILFGKSQFLQFVCVLNTLHLNENALSSARANKSVFYSLYLNTFTHARQHRMFILVCEVL